MKPTIRDVAEAAGVSVATVSRYLNNSSLIAPASIDKVRTAIDHLNYQPNMMARGLVKRNTDTIALVVDYSHEEIYENEFFLKIQVGLERELAKHGYYLMLVNISDEEQASDIIKKIILEERVDGIVLLNEMAKASVMDLLHKMEVPFVVTGRGEYADAAWVDIDNDAAGYMATKKLISSGMKRIGFITNSFEKRFVRERYLGFERAMHDSNIQFESQDIIAGLGTYQEQLKFLEENKRIFDAYVVTDSHIAFYFIKALKRNGLIIPDDVQIVAFDNQILAEISEPGITVVDIDVTALGVHTAKILLKNLHSMESKREQAILHELLGVQIIERGSTI